MIIKATEEQKKYVKDGLNNFGIRLNETGLKQKEINHFVGLLAEVIICDLLKVERPVIKREFDAGFDVIMRGIKFDIKTVLRNVDFKPHYVHNVSASQLYNSSDGFIFLSYNIKKDEFDIRGYILKYDFLKHSQHFGFGSKRYRDDGSVLEVQEPFYELEDRHLNVIEWFI